MTAGKKPKADEALAQERQDISGKMSGALGEVIKNRDDVAKSKKELEAARRNLDQTTAEEIKKAFDDFPPERMFLPGTQQPISENFLMQLLHVELYNSERWQKAEARYIEAQNALVDADTRMLNAGDTLGVTTQRARLLAAFMQLAGG